jgi:hypothetical protein
MSLPVRKVERLTVHSDAHLLAVLRLAGLRYGSADTNVFLHTLYAVGSYHQDRFSVYRDIESVYTIYYTPGD